MPELPEAENIVRGLQKLKNKKVSNILIYNKKIIKTNFNLYPQLKNTLVKKIERAGKGILIYFSKDIYIYFSLGMTGKLIITKNKIQVKHLHFSLSLQSYFLNFIDIRKFGGVFILKKEQAKFKEIIAKKDRDALRMKFKTFLNLIRSSSQPVKIFLMDQSKIAGIGNIYANEILFKAKINPKTKCYNLSLENIKKIYSQIKQVLKQAIKYGGSSVSNYVDAENKKGSFQNYHLVYNKKKCICGQDLWKIKLGGRSTFYCENCQS